MDDSTSRGGDELQVTYPHSSTVVARQQSSFSVVQHRHLIHGAQAFCYRRYLFAAAPLTEALPTRPPLAAVPCLVLTRPYARGLRCGRLQAASFWPTKYSSTFTRSEAGRWALLVPFLR
ncbi:hypothetical protein HPB50_009333 [Hyalomma asiaticum]|uniref:Uncharacterized protein n=1 Tax=Hyalomma asiaticum TaxID=266040 RepID=A0ACB7RZ08_HYAAI|nr:hypothetical protein HPB50_009333 [Hyalomma asiaticum]